MDARHQSADNHKSREQAGKNACGGPDPDAADPARQLEFQRRHHAEHQQRGGRRIGRLHHPVDGDRPVIDGHHFKEQVARDDQDIVKAQQQNVCVHPQQASAPDPLRHAHSAFGF